MRGIRCEGRSVYLAEAEEKYFPYIIAWRNDPENNRYLNQPFLLDMEKQQAWYESYRRDPAQGLFIVVDKKENLPFATMGWTDHDPEENLCITGRLLVGDRRYRGSPRFAEATLLFADYMYGELGVDTCYAHIVCENLASRRYHEKYGYYLHADAPRFPHELVVNSMRQVEYVRSREDWSSVRESVLRCLTQGETQKL